METTTVKRRAAGAATRKGGQERGVHASPLAGAILGRTVKRLEPAPPRRNAKLWQLRLYVTGSTSKSLTAFANLKKVCESQLKGCYRITRIDLLKRPQLAKGDQILAIPTVVRRLPKPVRIIIGNLSDTARVLVGLDLRPAD
jgi:circadian clock protein KaiB